MIWDRIALWTTCIDSIVDAEHSDNSEYNRAAHFCGLYVDIDVDKRKLLGMATREG